MLPGTAAKYVDWFVTNKFKRTTTRHHQKSSSKLHNKRTSFFRYLQTLPSHILCKPNLRGVTFTTTTLFN